MTILIFLNNWRSITHSWTAVAALHVATGEIKTAKTTLKRREEFLQFMDQIVADAPPDRELHVILWVQ